MQRVEKTVFISYRRTNAPWALAIYKDLTHHGYDVFFDYLSIASGDFERVLLESIKARAHFVALLTPSALERCAEPGDWLRREIETALETQRNIVPLMLEGFDFATPAIAQHLTGQLAALRQYNALPVPAEYFDEAMTRLRDKYLNVPLAAVLHPLSTSVQQAVKTQQAAANAAPVVQEKDLTAQEWFEQGYKATSSDEKIRCYTEALRINPDYDTAYFNRGNVRYAKGDLDGALQDYAQALRINPDYVDAYFNRGNVRYAKGDLDGALQDYAQTPDYANAYFNRAVIWQKKANHAAAIADFQKYLDLGGGQRRGNQAAVEKRIRELKAKRKHWWEWLIM